MANLQNVITAQRRAEFFQGLSANIDKGSIVSPLAAYFAGTSARAAAGAEGEYQAQKDAENMAMEKQKYQLQALRSATDILQDTSVSGPVKAANAGLLLRQAGLNIKSLDTQNKVFNIEDEGGKTISVPYEDDKYKKALEKAEADIGLVKAKETATKNKPVSTSQKQASEASILSTFRTTEKQMISDLGNERARRRLSEAAIDDYIAKVDNMAVSEKTKDMLKANALSAKREKSQTSNKSTPIYKSSGKKDFSLLFK